MLDATFEQNGIPSFAKEGWLRHKENGPVPQPAQTGWLFQTTDYSKRSG
jgi:hypothetical protein